jgi:hypothetical protein
LGERRYSSYSFSTSELDGGEWSASRPGRAFTRGDGTPGTHWTGGWVGTRTGLDTEARGKILCPRREPNTGRPARSQTLLLPELTLLLAGSGTTELVNPPLNPTLCRMVGFAQKALLCCSFPQITLLSCPFLVLSVILPAVQNRSLFCATSWRPPRKYVERAYDIIQYIIICKLKQDIYSCVHLFIF